MNEANRANRAKGPAGHVGSGLRADLASRNQRLPLLGNDGDTRALGAKQGVGYPEAFHSIGPGGSRQGD